MTKPFRFGVFALSLALAGEAQARECQGVTMAEQVKVDDTVLTLNGMGVREATILNIDVYVAGLYLQERSSDGSKIASAEQKKQMRLRFVRDVDRDDMIENLDQGFRNGAGDAYPALKPRFERLKKWIPGLTSGDTFMVTYRPGAGLEVRHGKRALGVIEGADFARAIFMIWLGAKPPNPGLKTGLLGGACG